jgi:hypothetical protein
MEMKARRDDFLEVPLKKFQTSQGAVDLPILYPDYAYAHFLFWTDYERAAAKLRDTVFVPCRFIHRRAGVLLNFFNYRASAIGPYLEVGLSILCHPRQLKRAGPYMTQLMRDASTWTMGAYVVDLPVTTEIAYVGGREIWSYPKFVTNIAFVLAGKQFRGVVDDPELKEPLITLAGKMGVVGPGARLSTASFISHTTHQGTPLRTLTEVEARFKVNLGFSSAAQVNPKSRHVMAQNLRDLGLDGKKPFCSLYCEKARMILYEGVPVAESLR